MTSEPTATPIQPLPGDPFARLEGPLAGTVRMRLEVVENRPLTPAMQQVVFTAPELAGFSYRPGQDVMLLVDVDGGRPVRRRYTIRSLDRAARRLTLGIVRHSGGGPGERWVQAAAPGDTLEGIGPRGKIFPAEGADWHLFTGDFSALPAYLTMAASLPAGTPATVILEVPGAADEQPFDRPGATVIWRHSGGRPPGDPAALVDALGSVPLPAGRGHAYLAGEAKVVLALRETLAARGMAPDQMSPKAYWGRGKANASHGEPARDDS